MKWLWFLIISEQCLFAQEPFVFDAASVPMPVSACPFNGLLIWDSGVNGIKFSNADVTDVTTNINALNCYYNESTLYSLANDGDNDVTTVSNLVTLPVLTNLNLSSGPISNVEGGHLTNVYWLQALDVSNTGPPNVVVRGMTNLVLFYFLSTARFYNIDGCYNLVDLSIDDSLSDTETTYYLTNLDAMGAVNGTISLNGSVPTSEGMTASNNLVVKGWTVNP